MPKSTGSVSGVHFHKIATSGAFFLQLFVWIEVIFHELDTRQKCLLGGFCTLNNIKAVHGAKCLIYAIIVSHLMVKINSD